MAGIEFSELEILQLSEFYRGYETGTGHNGTAKGRKRLRMDRMPQ